MKTGLSIVLVVAAAIAQAGAQSLNERPAAPAASAPASAPEQPQGPAPVAAAPQPITRSGANSEVSNALRGISLFLVSPPPPRNYQKHDIVEILINEISSQKSEQTLDTKKDYTMSAELTRFPSLSHLWELQLEDGDSTPIAGVAAKSNNKFKGEGDYERSDRFVARVAAVVVEVKPNGTLLLEARKQVTSNKEETTLVLCGLARPDDITANNTVQSSQLANLTLTVSNDGDVKKSASKGVLTWLLDTIFNF